MSDLMDRAALFERFGNDREIILEVAGMFLEDCPGLLAQVGDAVRAREAQDVLQAAHRLRGVVANFSSTVAERLLDLEQRGSDGELEGVEELRSEIEDLLARLQREVERLLETESAGPPERL